MSEKARKNKSAKISSSMEHVGHTLDKDGNDLSGQLQKVNITHHHAGANAPEKMIKSERDHSPAMDAAIPVTGSDQDGD
jgi:hypothetical protein